MDIYIAILEDRHIDTCAFPFSTYEKALEQCNNWSAGEDDFEIRELTEGMERANWVYYGKYGEDDSIRIIKTSLDRLG